MKYQLTFALVASLTGTAFAEFKAPLPEFKNEKQLTEWRAERASEATSQGYAAEQTAFYTGRPYLGSSGGYAFKYRNYIPNLARWTAEDPSGFPDGANSQAYAPTPTSQIDIMGLVSIDLAGSTTTGITGSNVTMQVTEAPKQIGESIAAMTRVKFTAPGKTGWIIQQVTNDWSKVLNDSGNSAYAPANPPTQNYWEAWAVTGANFVGSDGWNTIAFPESTHGEFTMKGKVGFYSINDVQGSSPTSWGIQAPESGILLSTTTPPPWWTGAGFDRNLTMKWE